MSSGDSGFSCCVLMAYLVCFICHRSKCFICFISSHAAPPVGLPSFVTAMADYITHSHPELLATAVDFPPATSLCVQFLSRLLLFVVAVYWPQIRMGRGDKTSTCGLTGVSVLCKMDFAFSERLCQENRRLQTPVCHRHQRPGPYLHAGEAARGSGPHQHRACQKGGESPSFCF